MTESQEALFEESYKDKIQRLARERSAAMEAAVDAHLEMQAAKDRYREAILNADVMNCNISEIARRVGMSETSIRMFIKRQREN